MCASGKWQVGGKLIDRECFRLFAGDMKSKALTLFAALFFCLITAGRAQLVFEKTEIELHPKATDADAVANFKYENKGKTPIKIKSVKSSCGCTVASSRKDEVGPGEKGEVTATFHIGGRTGVQQKGITVETDDAAQPVMNLMLKAVIEQPLEIQPQFVYWQAGEKPSPKSFKVKAGKDVTLTKVEIATSNPDYTAKVEKVSAGEFNIMVQPKDTAQVSNATFTIKTDLPQPYYVTARVTPAAGAAR
jgi:hypothetical protein